jgi:hypothetical protein
MPSGGTGWFLLLSLAVTTVTVKHIDIINNNVFIILFFLSHFCPPISLSLKLTD